MSDEIPANNISAEIIRTGIERRKRKRQSSLSQALGSAPEKPPTCMGCRKPLVPEMMVAYWDPEDRELVCNECASTGKVVFLGPPKWNVQVMPNADFRDPATR